MKPPVALLDTTIQIDRKKGALWANRIEEILSGYKWKVATSIGLLEFKATMIQACITIHGELRKVGRYTAVRDRLTESTHRQAKLRGHIFTNLVNVFAPSSFEVTEERDRRLAEKARLRLEKVIPRLYRWFTRKSVDVVLKDDIQCTRALEPPQKKGVAFGVNLPKCRRGQNKFCQVEEFIRARGSAFVKRLEEALGAMKEESDQLRQTCELFKKVLENTALELSVADCRSAGDCLIGLEGCGHATHALSTNAREWGPICGILGCEFVRVDYQENKPGKATRPR